MALTTFSGPVKSENGFIGAFTSTEIVLQSDNANTITLDAPNGLAASYNFILPGNDGDNGQMLTTNGSGVTTWTTPFNPTAPGAIGGGTAAAGTFTALVATSVGVTNTSSSTSLYEPVVVASTNEEDFVVVYGLELAPEDVLKSYCLVVVVDPTIEDVVNV